MIEYSDLINRGLVCGYCEAPTELVDSSVGASYGKIYLCASCNAYVGVHKGTTRALGRVANESLRKWRKAAHAYFDPIWKAAMTHRGWSKKVARTTAYEWLSEQMGLKFDDTHIALFNEDQCKQCIEICRKIYKKQ